MLPRNAQKVPLVIVDVLLLIPVIGPLNGESVSEGVASPKEPQIVKLVPGSMPVVSERAI